jgi:putative protein kinase ArgK-like GTPase of G3E family
MVRESGRDTPVLQTTASEGQGVEALFTALLAARTAGGTNAARSVRFEVLRAVRDRSAKRAADVLDGAAARAIFARLSAHETTRRDAAEALLQLVLPEG